MVTVARGKKWARLADAKERCTDSIDPTSPPNRVNYRQTLIKIEKYINKSSMSTSTGVGLKHDRWLYHVACIDWKVIAAGPTQQNIYPISARAVAIRGNIPDKRARRPITSRMPFLRRMCRRRARSDPHRPPPPALSFPARQRRAAVSPH